jgi:hypothetical protein
MTELLKPKDELTAIVDNSDYGDVSIPTNLKDHTWFVKYESTNPLLSDTDTGDEWHIQITADERTGLTEDHGCIIDFVGYRRGEIAMTRNGEILNETEAEAREDASGENFPRFKAYDFKIKNLEKTTGPIDRERLSRTFDQQRQESERNLIDTLDTAFSRLGGVEPNASPASVQAYLQGLDPSQRKAIVEMADDEIEESEEAVTS